MAEELDNMSEEMEEVEVITMTAEDGTESYYIAEGDIEVDGKLFVILTPVHMDDHHEGCGDECDCCSEGESFVARIDDDENGEPVFVSPTEEEFDAVLKAWEAMDEEEA